VATLHIRNVPPEVVESLKERAARHGRSLNTEVVRTLEEAAQKRSLEEVFESVRRRAERIPNPPTTEEIVEGIRRDREERTDRILRAAGLLPPEDEA
jgi:plasmid stability protein